MVKKKKINKAIRKWFDTVLQLNHEVLLTHTGTDSAH